MTTRELFSFPNPVNEKAARSVAGGVVLLAALTLGLSVAAGHGWLWISAVLAYGFLARVLTGPTLSPLGQFATRFAAPRLGTAHPVAGPPKRFAQAIAAVAQALLVVIIVAAVLESVFADCIGCKVFAGLMRLGLIPAETCAACANITVRTQHCLLSTSDAADEEDSVDLGG